MLQILELLGANRYLLAAGALFLAAGVVYFKGYSTGKNSAQKAQDKAQENLEKEIRAIESLNQKLDKKRAQDVEAVNRTRDVRDLIGLWNNVLKKAPSDKTGKK